MAVQSNTRVPHLVVDAGVFLKRARLETFGSKIYTTAPVISELRDPQIREAINGLPYALHFETPSQESLKIITAMAKKTGDFFVLSSTDLGLIALTYDLYMVYVGEPASKPVVSLPCDLGSQARAAVRPPLLADKTSSFDKEFQSVSKKEKKQPEEGDGDDFIPSGSDWISESNFDEKSQDNFGLGVDTRCEERISSSGTDAEPSIIVACLTTDFAMQNVLFHLGLPIISLNGMHITRPRTHLLWCGCCYRPTKRTDTYFCPSCGQPNLRRIPVSLMEDGQLQFHFARRFVSSRRGCQQPIRRPRGGKHADEPIYCADQRLPERRPAKPKHPNVQPIASNGLLEDLLADDFDTACYIGFDGGSVFPLHDVTSRSARIGLRSDHQIPGRSWFKPMGEHGLKPTRGEAHLSKPRTGNKKKKRHI